MSGRRRGSWGDALAVLVVALVAGLLAPLSSPASAAAPGPVISTVASTIAAAGLSPTLVDGFDYVGHDGSGALYGRVGTINGLMKFSPGGTLAASPAGDYGGYTGARMAIAADGTRYVSETGRIVRIEPDGTATVVAGTGTFGFSGDGGLATAAQIAANTIAVGTDGTLVLFEATRIRRMTVGGNIATIAGTGTAGNTGDNGPATSAQIQPSSAGTVDGSNRPVFANGECVLSVCRLTSIRRVETDGTITTRYAPVGGESIVDVASAADGTIYYSTAVDLVLAAPPVTLVVPGGLIKRVTTAGAVSVVAGIGPDDLTPAGDGGPATAAAGGWRDIDVLADGSIVAMEPIGPGLVVRRFAVGGNIDRIAGGGSVATSTVPSGPLALAGSQFLVGANGLVADPAGGMAIATTSSSAEITRATIARNPGAEVDLYDLVGTGPSSTRTRTRISAAGASATTAVGFLPQNGTYRADGTLVYFDGDVASDDCRVWELPSGGTPRVLAGAALCPQPPALVPARYGSLAASIDGAVYNTTGDQVLRIAPDGAVTAFAGKSTGCPSGNSGDGGPAIDACFNFMTGLALDGAGNVFVSTPTAVRRIDGATGTITTVAGMAGSSGAQNTGDGGPATAAELANAGGIAFDLAGNLYISTNSAVRKVTGLGVPFGGTLVPVVPERLLETRSDGQAGYSGGKPGPGAVVELQITGVGHTDVPDDAVAVVLNITATEATADGFVTVWPCGEERPNASNLNLVRGGTAPNLVISKIGAGGKVCIYTQSGAHLLADVSGFYPPGAIVPVSPERLLETRSDGQNGYSGGKPTPGAVVELQITGAGRTGVPGDAKAVVLNVTGVDATADGFVTVWPCGEDRPNASNLNLRAGSVVPNLVIAKIGAAGKVCLFSQNGTHLLADVAGYFPAGAPLVPVSPERLLETRLDGQAGYSGAKPTGGQTVELQVTGVGRTAVPTDAAAAVLNVTGVDATAAGFVTVWPCGEERPTASNLNLTAGAVVPNLVITKIGAGGKVCLYTQSGTHLIADINGYVPAA